MSAVCIADVAGAAVRGDDRSMHRLRGIFLDRGELEQLAEAEAKFYSAQQQPQSPPSPYPPQQQYPAQPVYVEGARPRGFLGGLFGEGYYGGRHGGYRGGHH
ncbi:hypothetical protein I552_4063 [Mycobacterium xenopi 3993]|nr:hypothetical protein I552_4063 [Mycobacterium xenopi 3993]